ncbi:MAG TPA: S8 family serine peptidase, partial [Nevskiaceae bacterium]|nr:S8 family serine peptidase [Nevskiaceae bacterium]
VLPGQAGEGDEGTAMLEILHDLAPEAELGFATAFNGEAQFAQNILDLAADGCDVIVDDVIYFDESPFQDGPVAQAVNQVTAAGVLYFSSAGNEGNLTDGTSGTWEGDFTPNGQLGGLSGNYEVHNFGDGQQSIAVTRGGIVTILTWAEHTTLTGGLASTDFGLYVFSPDLSRVVDFSDGIQDGLNGDDRAFEFVSGALAGERLVVVRNLPAGSTSSVPMFNLIQFRGGLDPLLATRGATRGHSAAVEAFSTAATPASVPFNALSPEGPFPGLFGPESLSELFSADGPRRILLDPDGAELCPGNRTSSCEAGLRAKPDITAADGVATTAPGFERFFGTSAAAPHAAAIAALIQSVLPDITPAQVRQALTGSAIDIEAPGNDAVTGAGIVMAEAALEAAGATPQPLLRLAGQTFTPVRGDGDGDIEPGERWSLQIEIENLGAVTAQGLSAQLTSPAGDVAVVDGTVAYPDLASGARAVGLASFVFDVPVNLPCGAPVRLSLTLPYNGIRSPLEAELRTLTGGSGAAQSFAYSGSPVAIPECCGSPITVPVEVSGLSTGLTDLDFAIGGSLCSTDVGSTTVGLDHTFTADLELSLISPAGTSVILVERRGGSGNNFCQTVLDDEAAVDVSAGSAPFTGRFRPDQPLSAFDGEDPNGTWLFRVDDQAGIDIGSVRAFSLEIGAARCDAPLDDGQPPRVLGVRRLQRSPTNATYVQYEVLFSKPVSGVDRSDLQLRSTGLTGASVVNLTGSGERYVLNVLTASEPGQGSLGLDLMDDDSIVSAVGIPLGGSGAGNGAFRGEDYEVDRLAPTVQLRLAEGQAEATSDPLVRFALEFSEPVQGLTTSSLRLGGDARVSEVSVAGLGTSYLVRARVEGGGTLSLSLPSGAAFDAAGNLSAASAAPAPAVRVVVATATLAFERQGQTLLEPAAAGERRAVPLVVSLSEPLDSPLELQLVAEPYSTASEGEDYEPLPRFTIPAGATEQTVEVFVLGDEAEEGSEFVALTFASAPPGTTLGTPFRHRINLLDEESLPAFTFEEASSSGREGRTVRVDVRLSEEAGNRGAGVLVRVVGGTATEGEDFRLLNPMLRLRRGDDEAELRLRLAEDEVADAGETIELELVEAVNGRLGTIRRHTVTIDNARPR